VKLSQAARAMGGQLWGQDIEFSSISTDTRTLQTGDVFLALQGPNFDGASYFQEAIEKGAVAVVAQSREGAPCPVVLVKDSRLALGRLAQAWKAQTKLKCVALTGSCGKTTVKEMLASILNFEGNTLATEGNLNNDIGVPLTLLKIDSEHRYAVIELGASGMGEIAYSSQLVKPDVALVTNIGSAHVEGFGDLNGVAQAKSEIFSSLSDQGTAVVNLNEPYAEGWLKSLGDKKVLAVDFKPNQKADIYLENWAFNGGATTKLWIKLPFDAVEVNLSFLGQHNAQNAVLAAAAAFACGASRASIKKGLEALRPIAGRLQVKKSVTGKTIIDDSYNANPHSVRAAIDTLGQYEGKQALILGTMGELGSEAASYHHQVGEYARLKGLKKLIAVGEYCNDVGAGYGKTAQLFEDNEMLMADLERLINDDEVVLVKGSRSARMENIVNMIVERL